MGTYITPEERRIERTAAMLLAVHGDRPQLLPQLYQDCYEIARQTGQLPRLKRVPLRRATR